MATQHDATSLLSSVRNIKQDRIIYIHPFSNNCWIRTKRHHLAMYNVGQGVEVCVYDRLVVVGDDVGNTTGGGGNELEKKTMLCVYA